MSSRTALAMTWFMAKPLRSFDIRTRSDGAAGSPGPLDMFQRQLDQISQRRGVHVPLPVAQPKMRAESDKEHDEFGDPCQREPGPETGVRTPREGQVPIRRPVQNDPVRFGELAR